MMNGPDMEKKVMDAIRAGQVRMRPRWRFWFSSALAALGIIILLLTLLYLTSFAVFSLRQSGVLFVPVFGMRGVFVFLHALPLLLIGLLVLFVIVLEVLVRRYAFVYRKPLLTSVFSILVIVILGGVALDHTHIHGMLYGDARAHLLPPPIAELYRSGVPHIPDVNRGVVVSIMPQGLVLQRDQGGTTTVLIEHTTRLPLGKDFTVGQEIVVFGDQSSGTIRAFGIRPIGN